MLCLEFHPPTLILDSALTYFDTNLGSPPLPYRARALCVLGVRVDFNLDKFLNNENGAHDGDECDVLLVF